MRKFYPTLKMDFIFSGLRRIICHLFLGPEPIKIKSQKVQFFCLIIFILLLGGTDIVKSQTTLSAGDILITSFDATKTVAEDKFSFVTLKDLQPNTVIYFTDRGYFGGNSWQAANGGTEGSIAWSLGSDNVSAGTEVVIQGLNAKVNNVVKGIVSSVPGSNGSGLSLASPSGDQIIVFQGGAGNPSASGVTMVGGFHWNYCPIDYYSVYTTDSSWDTIGVNSSCSAGPNSSNMPPGLNASSAFWVGFFKPTPPAQNIQNYTKGQFNGAGAPFSSLAALKAAILDRNNWTALKFDDPTVVNVPTGITYYSSCTAPAITSQPSASTICVGANTTFTVVASNATGYQWQVNEGSGFTNISNNSVYSGANTATLTVTGTTAGLNGFQYRLIATGACTPVAVSNGAVLNVSTVNGSISKTNVSCNGGSNGTATVVASGGVGGYTYSWAPSGGTNATATGLSVGVYTVTITDSRGCTGTVSTTITQPPAITATTSQTNVSCNGGSNGTATVVASGGAGGYTYSWAPSGGTNATATGLSVGVYTVTVTDANSCFTTKSVTITQPTAVSGTTVVTNVACNGASNGAINLTPTGGTAPYTFNWGGGITTEDRIGLAAGTYTVIITDANGCTGTVNATVTQPATAVSGTTFVTNVECNGASNGAINLTPTGGTAPYTFNWGGGITTEDRTGLAAGTYTVTITDANGCTETVNATVTQPATAVSGTTVITNVACNGSSNGAINLTPTGGTEPYTFNWGGGITTEDRTGLAAGTYTVTITDANGCTKTVNATVSQPTALSATISQTNISCNGGSNGSASITVSGGTAPYTYSWSPTGGTAATATGLSAGVYIVTVTDFNSCTTTRTVTITQPTAVSGTTVVTNVSCNGSSNGSINLTPTGGTAPYTFNWGGGITTEDRTGLAAGTYTVTITDANGCTRIVNATVTQPSVLIATPSSTNVSCNGGTNGSASVNVTGGTPGYTYLWSNGATTPSVNGLAAGTYTVIVTDANGCQTSQAIVITESAAVSAPTGAATQSFNAGDTLSALVVSGQNIKWYATADDATNHINSLSINTLIVNKKTYYATQMIGVCESKASLAVLAWNESLNVVNNNSKPKIEIYPNPVKEVLHFNGDDKINKIVIMSIDGKKVSEKLMNGERKLNVHTLIQGTYLINIFTDKGLQTIKFIKN